jgi:hypothetical protein
MLSAVGLACLVVRIPESGSRQTLIFYSAPMELATGTTIVPLLDTDHRLYGPRRNQIDMRFGKILNFGNKRANIAVDVLNLFNANTGTAFQQNYGDGSQYLNPTAILNPRFVRFNVTVDF